MCRQDQRRFRTQIRQTADAMYVHTFRKTMCRITPSPPLCMPSPPDPGRKLNCFNNTGYRFSNISGSVMRVFVYIHTVLQHAQRHRKTRMITRHVPHPQYIDGCGCVREKQPGNCLTSKLYSAQRRSKLIARRYFLLRNTILMQISLLGGRFPV